MGQAGLCSRREAESLIADGKVSIDGQIITSPGHKIQPGQTLLLSQATRAALQNKFSAVLYKPVGIVSAQPEPGEIPAARLLTRETLIGPGKPPGAHMSLPALGRLDKDSRGLLILSQDGVLAKALIGPDGGMEKEYIVKVKGDITEAKIAKLCHGLHLDNRALKPAKVTQIDPQSLRFILKEGRNRQIRRMCDDVDLRVFDLLRIRIGSLKLGTLKSGHWRLLTDMERSKLIGQKPQPSRQGRSIR